MASRGDYYVAIKAHDDLISNQYLYSRMGVTARYQAHLSLGVRRPSLQKPEAFGQLQGIYQIK